MAAKASLVIALLAATAAADDKKYSLADLEALVADRAYQEAVAHLTDIAPGQRSGKWLDLATTAVTGLLVTFDRDDGTALYAIDAIDRELPQLLKSSKYTQLRGELGVAGLAGCYQRDSSNCTKLALRLVDGDGKLALDVAKAITQHGNASDAVPLFKRAISKSVCKDEHLERATIAGISRSAPNADARAIVLTCWDDVKDAVTKAFDDAGKGSYVHKNTCDILETKRLLSPLQIKRCAKAKS